MIHQLISNRKSTVLFDSESAISSGDLHLLFEAARWAPSSMNQQPWSFVYALRGEESFEKFIGCLAENNRRWARNASVLIHVAAQVISDYKERRNVYAWHDCGLAFSNMVFQATSLGISVHPMGGFDRDITRRDLGLPDKFEPVIFAALGYRSDKQNFPEDLLKREQSPRERKEPDEFVFKNYFGQIARERK